MDKIYKENKAQKENFLTGPVRKKISNGAGFTLDEILKATNGKLINGNENILVKGISTDTRAILPGELFIALKGENFDGHKFIKTAFEKGAKAAICDNPRAPLEISNTYGKTKFLTGRVICDHLRSKTSFKGLIKVKDTRKALGDIASFYRGRLKIPIVGITGSNGKTTAKDIIAHILSKKYKVAKTFNTENNLIGTPLTLLKVKNESYAVVEMGTNAPGEIEYLAKIVRPDVGIITNIGPSHLQGLKTLEGILKEKKALFDHLEKKGCAIINKDDPLLSSLKIKNKTLAFGIKNKKCNYHADEIKFKQNGMQFVLNKRYKFILPIFGVYNVYNALAAIAACCALGTDIKICQSALLDFKPPKMRFCLHRLNNINIINDAYNSNPLSMKAALETLCALEVNGRKIVVAADMLELGKDAGMLHYEIGTIIAKSGVDVLVTVGEISDNIAKGAKNNGMHEEAVKSFKNPGDAAKFLLDIKRPNDTILVKGSRAMKMEELVQCFITSYTH